MIFFHACTRHLVRARHVLTAFLPRRLQVQAILEEQYP